MHDLQGKEQTVVKPISFDVEDLAISISAVTVLNYICHLFSEGLDDGFIIFDIVRLRLVS